MLGIGRSDKTIALRHRETLNFHAFVRLGRIPGQAGDDGAGGKAGLKSNGVGRMLGTWLHESGQS